MEQLLDHVRETFADPVVAAWLCVGIVGTAIFNSRFYVQWYVSEKKKRSVVPTSFWYLSSIGAIILLVYSIHKQSPNGGLSYSLNTVIYSRNLVHIWRNKGKLTRTRSIVFQSIVGLIAIVAVAIVITIWWREIEHTKTKQQHEAVATWLWIAVGVLGQALFAGRFIIQWIATEVRRKSVMPNVFWHMSLVAALLLCASFSAQREWLLALGPIINVPVYLRNIWFIHRRPDETATTPGAA
ncbi:MAG TPA: lipid-A-disaccharide synthase N-terminal domain-containing protein [Candidatus Hydrogenedentes bacterium]|nr:lipid-A-disaccharide synthase N-terminal domain-containing protein [Candidatus Hydrogenedentota bacterium]HRK36574.1 lipid-A-disaccharide synthase N-terminal domain-containing protein [Candidatus Hydrogenedentota bacterium]